MGDEIPDLGGMFATLDEYLEKKPEDRETGVVTDADEAVQQFIGALNAKDEAGMIDYLNGADAAERLAVAAIIHQRLVRKSLEPVAGEFRIRLRVILDVIVDSLKDDATIVEVLEQMGITGSDDKPAITEQA